MWNMFQVNNKDTSQSGVFTVNVEHISHMVVVLLLLPLKI